MGWANAYVPVLRILIPPWNSSGWLLIVAGVLIDLVSVVAFVRAKTTINPLKVERATRLVITGSYRWSRNPMYLGMLAILIGWAMLLGSLSPWLMIVAFERLIVLWQIRPEEAALAKKFGTDFSLYSQQVNRWFGRNSR